MFGSEEEGQSSWTAGLSGKRILIVEDDYFLANDMREALEAMGAVILGPVGATDDALVIAAADNPDAAILDIRLETEDAFPVADVLMRRGIPFVFASASDRGTIPRRFEGYCLVPKPLEIRLIIESLFGPPH